MKVGNYVLSSVTVNVKQSTFQCPHLERLLRMDYVHRICSKRRTQINFRKNEDDIKQESFYHILI